MVDISTLPFVVALCVVATLAAVGLVGRLLRRPRPSLRARAVTLIIGLVGVELVTLPALGVALVGDDLLGVRASGVDHWIAIAVYAALVLYAIVRLFPWPEVKAMAADPNATLGDVMARMAAKNHQRATRSDEREPP
jgi:hypothetical protein